MSKEFDTVFNYIVKMGRHMPRTLRWRERWIYYFEKNKLYYRVFGVRDNKVKMINVSFTPCGDSKDFWLQEMTELIDLYNEIKDKQFTRVIKT